MLLPSSAHPHQRHRPQCHVMGRWGGWSGVLLYMFFFCYFGPKTGSRRAGRGFKRSLEAVGFILAEFELKRSHGDPIRDNFIIVLFGLIFRGLWLIVLGLGLIVRGLGLIFRGLGLIVRLFFICKLESLKVWKFESLNVWKLLPCKRSCMNRLKNSE